MKRQLLLLAVLSTVTLIPITRANSQDTSLCYMQKNNGQTVDLSKLCNKASTVTPNSFTPQIQSEADRSAPVPSTPPFYQTQPNSDGTTAQGMSIGAGGGPIPSSN